jgi:ubiquinone/menaquinone biosynthesis C-methylase UbiE
MVEMVYYILMSFYQKTIVPRLLNSAMGAEDLMDLRREVLKDASGIVLEIGVGPGYNLPLYKNIEKLFALEPSPELTAMAKTRAPASLPIAFLNTPAEYLPFLDHSIDTVVSTWTMCSVTDPAKVLQEIKRVLKPTGRFIFVDHGASPNGGMRAIQTGLTTITKYFTGNCHYDRPLDQLITEAGFTIAKMSHPLGRGKPLIYQYRGVATPLS